MINIFRKKYETLTPTQARARLAEGAVLIDVRSTGEWNAGHAPEARHVPLDTLETKLGSLPKSTPVVAICASGMRSASAARILSDHGYAASTVSGGMSAWNRSSAK
ncbi:MAG: rhodanese-like domain-containing protein [Rhodoglobus sp.]